MAFKFSAHVHTTFDVRGLLPLLLTSTNTQNKDTNKNEGIRVPKFILFYCLCAMRVIFFYSIKFYIIINIIVARRKPGS